MNENLNSINLLLKYNKKNNNGFLLVNIAGNLNLKNSAYDMHNTHYELIDNKNSFDTL